MIRIFNYPGKRERKYYVKYPGEDFNSGNFTSEVSIYKHLLMTLQLKLPSYCFKETIEWKKSLVFNEIFYGLKISNCHCIIHFFYTFWRSWAFQTLCRYVHLNLLYTCSTAKKPKTLKVVCIFKIKIHVENPFNLMNELLFFLPRTSHCTKKEIFH